MILVAVIDMNIIEITCADLNHLVRNILKSDFIIFYTVIYEQTWKAPANNSNAVRFQRTKTFKADNL